jgi:hypothetical protein
MLSLLPSFLLFLGNVYSSITTRQLTGCSHSRWAVSNFNSLVAFGNSYIEENRLNYFGIHNGSAPLTGTFFQRASAQQVVVKWEPSMTLQFVVEYEIPVSFADKKSDSNGTTEAYFTPALISKDTVYAMWIGIPLDLIPCSSSFY